MNTSTQKKRSRLLKGAVAATGIVGMLALAGCTAADGAGDTQADGASCGPLALFVGNLANPWIAEHAQGTEDYAKANGIDLKVYDAELDVQTQISQVQQAIADKVAGILIGPVEADGIVPAIKQANEAGIPVIAVNANIGEGADVVTFVGVDHYDYGVGLAELAMMAAPDGGNVAIIQGIVGNPVEVLRTEAINDTLAKQDNIEIVATVTDNWNNTENIAVVQDLLTKFGPGELDVVIAEGPEIYIGAQYAHSVGRDDVAFVAGDFPVQVRDAIEAGEVFGTVLQDGPAQGIAGVEAMCSWLAGDEDAVERPEMMIDLPLVTKENVGEFTTTWDW